MGVLKVWIFLLLGIAFDFETTESRAVNISNTWTLPQEEFSVFYRFFRDKISWFEADAVCQFHHANLVTVDNGVQFDAARAFLKELDVTEPVWIGLMRPQNSERFMWTSSKPLDVTSGYWAESLPLLESPLCAVIDPVRDFRWHALRCGGPETAAFLCELNVPSWATECAITAMPSLTVQYMSDSGTIQLSRDCGDEGGRHMTCKGKQDRDFILKQLICNDENPLEISENNLITSEMISPSPVPGLNKDIESIDSDNNEDNNIDLHVNKIDLRNDQIVRTPTEKTNLDDMMIGDQPILPTSGKQYSSPVEEVVTKSPSKLVSKKDKQVSEKKIYSAKKAIIKTLHTDEEMMQGDQPMEIPIHLANEDKSSEILPHVKKMLPQDLKAKEVSTTQSSQIIDDDKIAVSTFVPSTELTNEPSTIQILSTTTVTSTTDNRQRRETESTSSVPLKVTTEIYPTDMPVISTTIESQSTTSVVANTERITPVTTNPEDNSSGKGIVHPLHISSEVLKQSNPNPNPNSNIPYPKFTHRKDDASGSDDHFIPPMLLVKAKFTSTRSHLETTVTEATTDLKISSSSSSSPASTTTSESVTESNNIISSTQPTDIVATTSETTVVVDEKEYSLVENGTLVDVVELAEKHKLNVTTEIPQKQNLTDTIIQSSIKASEQHVVEIKIDNDGIHDKLESMTITTRPIIPAEISQEITAASTSTILGSSSSSSSSEISTSKSLLTTNELSTSSSSELPRHVTNEFFPITSAKPLDPTTLFPLKRDASEMESVASEPAIKNNLPSQRRLDYENSFSNVENFQPYRPNRRRSLTKPETASYLKKILG